MKTIVWSLIFQQQIKIHTAIPSYAFPPSPCNPISEAFDNLTGSSTRGRQCWHSKRERLRCRMAFVAEKEEDFFLG
jgi:hypothetical protein